MLGIGLDLWSATRGAGGGAAQLLSSALLWFEPNDKSTLWKDVEGTDPVTAPGDIVLRMDTKSDSGHNAIQSTSADAPIYREINGFGSLDFSGDKFMEIPTLSVGVDSDYTIIGAYVSVKITDRVYLISDTANFIVAIGNNTGKLGFFATDNTWRDLEADRHPLGRQVTTWQLISGIGTAEGYRDGSLTGTSDFSGGNLTLESVQLGARAGNGDFSDIHFYGAVLVTPALSDSDRQIAAARMTAQVYPNFALTNATTIGTDVRASQGVAASADYFWTTGQGATNNHYINTYENNDGSFGALLHSQDIVGSMTASANQVNGLFYDPDTGKLYSGANNFSTTPSEGWIVELDVAGDGSLSIAAEHSAGAGWTEGAAKWNGSWWTVSHDKHEIKQWDTDWNAVATHALPAPDLTDGANGNLYQAIGFADGFAFVNLHGNNSAAPLTLVFKWNGNGFDFLDAMAPPSDDSTQGFFFATDGESVYFAERVGNISTNDANVIKATKGWS